MLLIYFSNKHLDSTSCILATVLRAVWHDCSFIYSLHRFSQMGAVFMPTLQMKRLGLRGHRLAQEYKEQRHDLHPGNPARVGPLIATPPRGSEALFRTPGHLLLFWDAALLTWQGCDRLPGPATPILVPAHRGPGLELVAWADSCSSCVTWRKRLYLSEAIMCKGGPSTELDRVHNKEQINVINNSSERGSHWVNALEHRLANVFHNGPDSKHFWPVTTI